jgi:hypothetical protein
MKAILEFNLPDDQSNFDLALQSANMYSSLHEIEQEIRRLWKYEELSEEQFKIVEQIRDKFNEILIENNINLK